MALLLSLTLSLLSFTSAQSINPYSVTSEYSLFAPGDNFVICANDSPFYTLQNGYQFTWRASDGNLNVYDPVTYKQIIWETNEHSQTCPSGKCCLMIFQGDGNLVQYNYDSNGNSYAYWDTGTANMGAAYLELREGKPYMLIQDSNGETLWSSTPLLTGNPGGGPGAGGPPGALSNPCDGSGCTLGTRDNSCPGG